MEKINYQKVMEEEAEMLQRQGRRPKLLLQSCCGPCSSHVLTCLMQFFEVTVYFYNPNIWPEEEYLHRLREQQRLLTEMCAGQVALLPARYIQSEFLEATEGLAMEPEGGKRCTLCFLLRLEETAQKAKELGYEYFTTTLSVSPHKDAERLNSMGRTLQEKYGVRFLQADFKKKDGYRHSIQLSKEYDLYRQNYCGCKFSVRDTEEKIAKCEK